MKKNPRKPERVAPCKPGKMGPLPSKPQRSIPDAPRPGTRPNAPLPPFPTPKEDNAEKKTLIGMCAKKRKVGRKVFGGCKIGKHISHSW